MLFKWTEKECRYRNVDIRARRAVSRKERFFETLQPKACTRWGPTDAALVVGHTGLRRVKPALHLHCQLKGANMHRITYGRFLKSRIE